MLAYVLSSSPNLSPSSSYCKRKKFDNYLLSFTRTIHILTIQCRLRISLLMALSGSSYMPVSRKLDRAFADHKYWSHRNHQIALAVVMSRDPLAIPESLILPLCHIRRAHQLLLFPAIERSCSLKL